jgi:hypothetical protein
MNHVLYQDSARYDLLFRVIQALPLAVIVFAAFSDFKMGEQVKYIVMGVVFIVGLSFWILMPRRFYIMEDRIKFIQGLGLSFNVRYDRIEQARELGRSAFNINLSTSSATPIELVMKKGMNINFSPEDRDEFLKKLNKAISDWRMGSR